MATNLAQGLAFFLLLDLGNTEWILNHGICWIKDLHGSHKLLPLTKAGLNHGPTPCQEQAISGPTLCWRAQYQCRAVGTWEGGWEVSDISAKVWWHVGSWFSTLKPELSTKKGPLPVKRQGLLTWSTRRLQEPSSAALSTWGQQSQEPRNLS